MKEDAKSKQPANGGFAEEFDRFVRTKFVDGGKRYTVSELCLLTAHHFADWQRQQMMKHAKSTTVYHRPNDFGEYDPHVCVRVSTDFQENEKVKVIIIKEDSK